MWKSLKAAAAKFKSERGAGPEPIFGHRQRRPQNKENNCSSRCC